MVRFTLIFLSAVSLQSKRRNSASRTSKPVLTIVLSVLLLLSIYGIATAQNYDSVAGFPAFVSTVNGQFDSVSLPYGNVVVALPVRSKVGKYPLTFTLVANSHMYIGAPSNSNYYTGRWFATYGIFGHTSGSQFSSSLNSGVNFTGTTGSTCQGGVENIYQNFVVVETDGTVHPVQPGIEVQSGYCGDSLPFQATTTDNSGYTMQLQGHNGGVQATLWDKSGNLLETPTAPPSCNGVPTTYCITDPDGVSITGYLYGGGNVVDTLGQNIITETVTYGLSGDKYVFNDVNGKAQTVQVKYTQITNVTGFGSGSIQDNSPFNASMPTSVIYPDGETITIGYEKNSLSGLPAWAPSHQYVWPPANQSNNELALVDSNGNLEGVKTTGTSGTTQPVWNKTVGGQTNDGTVVWQNYGSTWTSGRISSITYPQGGSVTYTYSDSQIVAIEGQQNGQYNFATWPAQITRTVNDNNGNIGKWTYQISAPSSNNGLVTVTETDPANNVTVRYFAGATQTGSGIPSNCITGYLSGCAYTYIPTATLSYSGAAVASNLVAKQVTCYDGKNSSESGCVTPTVPIDFPISQTDVYAHQVGTNGAIGSANDTQTVLDTYGNVTSLKKYGFGASFPPSGTPLATTTTLYNTGSTCGTLAIAAMQDKPCSVTVTDASGTLSQVKYTYNSAGHATQTSRLVSGSTYVKSSSTFNTNGTLATATDANNNKTTYNYDGSCKGILSTSTTYPTVNGVTATTSQTWECNGGVRLTATDANSQVTKYFYNDPVWRITEVDYPDGGSTTYCYTDVGGPTCTQSSPANALVVTKVIDNTISPPYSTSTTAIMDGLGRLKQTQLTTDVPGTDFTDTTYDSLGRVWKKSNTYRSSSSPTDGTTVYLYDALGRPCLMVPPDISTVPTSCPTSAPTGDVFTSYNSNCTTVTDEAGKIGKSCVDGLGRVIQVFEDPTGLNYETDYGYDGVNNLISVKQNGSSSPNARNRTFTYDALSRLVCGSNPENSSAACTSAALSGYISGTIGYNYDPNGNLTKKTAPLHNQTGTKTMATSYQYDALNRLVSKTYTDGTPSAQYGYDGLALSGCSTAPPSLSDPYPIGRRTAMCDGSGATSWSHDPMGRVASETRTIKGSSAITKTTGYVYNVDGSLNELTYPSGTILNYAYDQAQRPIYVADLINSITYANNATFAPPGLMTGFTAGATANFTGITPATTYNNRLQPTGISAATPTSTIFSLSYAYGTTGKNNGNLSAITNKLDGTRTVNFNYDSLNRIINALTANWGEAYTSDAWGNMTAINSYQGKAGETLNCGPANGQNQLNTCYTYDSAGNLVLNGSEAYTYDGENRLVGTAGWTYVYDGDGNRVKKSSTAGTLYWPDTSGRILSETDLTGALESDYVFFNGQRIARFDPKTLAAHYYFSNHLGSHTVVTNATGTCEQDIDYYPYGGEQKDYCPKKVAQHYMFSGKERDTESGLDKFGARYNASTMGRFMSPDPLGGRLIDPQTLNKYAYVRNNPATLIDPTGMYTCADQADCQSKQDKAFEAARQQDLKSKDPDVVRAASAYGDPTKDNGVNVQYGDPGKGRNGNTANDVRVDPNDSAKVQAAETVTIRSGQSAEDLAATVGHEGSHVADAQDFVATINVGTGAADQSMNLTKYATELKAYMVSQSILSSENVKRNFGDCGANPCTLGTGIMPAQARQTIQQLLANPANGYGVTPDKPGALMYPNLTTPK